MLDTVNKKFKLPRTKFAFVGLRDTVGKYVEPGLPNISGTFSGVGQAFSGSPTTATLTGAFYRINTTNSPAEGVKIQNSGDVEKDDYFGFDASNSNSIYGSSNTVQQPATQQHLYFYVGQYTQSATEQTAGLNTELFNGKVDLNAYNLSSIGKSFVSGLPMPSSRYEDLTLGASGTTYTATDNGYFWLRKTVDSSDYIIFELDSGMSIRSTRPSASSDSDIFIPCRKGGTVKVSYTGSGTLKYFRFIYAEGEVNV